MAQDGQLNKLLARTGLTHADTQNLTLRWNRVAGEIYLKHFFTRYPGLKRRYVAFIDRLVKSWPPDRPQRAIAPAAQGAKS